MKKILVFGATGDTGRYFVDYFIENNKSNDFKLIASGSRKTDYFRKIGIDYYRIDISNKEDFKILPSDIYGVVDLAGLMPARMEGYYPHKYIEANIEGTMNILDFCVEQKVNRILYAQSFGDIKDRSENNIVLKPNMTPYFNYNTDHTVYVMTKNFAVDLIRHYHERFNLNSFIFRLPTIYLWSKNDTYFVDGNKRIIGYRKIIDDAINGNTIEIWGDKSRKKDMVYVKDFCQMLYKALFVKIEYGHYNVGSGVGTSLEDQVKGIIEIFGKDKDNIKIVYRPDKPNAPQYIMDISNAERDLSYQPMYNYIDMLKDMRREMELDRFSEL